MPFEPFKRPDYAPPSETKNNNPNSPAKYPLPQLRKKIEVKKPPIQTEKQNIFEKRKKEGGATRSEFRKELEKYDPAIHLTKEERLAIEKNEMPWARFSERISEKDIKQKEKDLMKKRDYLPSNIKDRTKIKTHINEQIKLLEKKLKDKK